jgi:spore coat polysaccharide biosynthesis protein SpsF
MADGQQNKLNIAFIIQARMKSTRLPGKVLLPLPFNNGKPIIQWIIDAISLSKYSGDIIVATSKDPENDILCSYCKNNSVKYFRGDEQNVLSRFINIVKNNNYGAVVRLTADNPIIDTMCLDKAIAFHIQRGSDYTKTEGLPLGMNFEIISPVSLLDLETQNTSDYDREHVTPFIKNSARFKTDILNFDVDSRLKDLRLTIDYSSDYLMLSAIVSLIKNEPVVGIEFISNTFSDFPWIFEVNHDNIQKKQYNELKDELVAAEQLLERFDLTRAAKIINSYEA